MEIEVQGLRIQWDDKKNEINRKKHGLSLEEASYVFNDPYRKEYFDVFHSNEEDRYRVIGSIERLYSLSIRNEEM
ncbi:BrnT family toxin [Selenomonas sp.]|uniref:BrnT family toxin n=1 Tax=Selenomonas sp. TaxID=2053611 RepID=UPI0039BFE330